jgi:uncharacterized protein with HEPN domain
MSRRDDSVALRHMLDHAREAVAMLRGRLRTDIDTDRLLQLAITRVLEIIGEAASPVPKEGQTRHSGIPWQAIISTRHRIIHGYDTVDYDVVWHIVREELPALIVVLERALPGHGQPK